MSYYFKDLKPDDLLNNFSNYKPEEVIVTQKHNDLTLELRKIEVSNGLRLMFYRNGECINSYGLDTEKLNKEEIVTVIQECINHFFMHEYIKEEPKKKYVVVKNFSVDNACTKLEVMEEDDLKKAMEIYDKWTDTIKEIYFHEKAANKNCFFFEDDASLSSTCESKIMDENAQEHSYYIYMTKLPNPDFSLILYNTSTFEDYYLPFT